MAGLLDWRWPWSGGVFDTIDDVIPHDESAAHAARYKSAAGFGIDDANAKAPTIDPGGRFSGRDAGS